jgi:hypothetical protein
VCPGRRRCGRRCRTSTRRRSGEVIDPAAVWWRCHRRAHCRRRDVDAGLSGPAPDARRAPVRAARRSRGEGARRRVAGAGRWLTCGGGATRLGTRANRGVRRSRNGAR